MKLRLLALAATGFAASLSDSAVQAQLVVPLLQPVIPFNYSRGRNVSVTERPRPEYQAIGVNTGGFTLYPKLQLGAGGSSNVYETPSSAQSGAYFSIDPTVRAVSNWSRHNLTLDAGGSLLRYADQTLRNEDGWHVTGSGRVDVAGDSDIYLSAGTAKLYESKFAGSSPGNIASGVPFQYSNGNVRGETTLGRFRLVAAGDYTHLAFFDVATLNDARINQKYRDTDSKRVTGQIDYALTPDTSLFAQVGYSNTGYANSLPNGNANRDGNEVRAIGGVSLDLTALLRGSFGIGYSRHNYNSPLYRDVSGLTIESRFEYFPTELTTVTFAVRRAIQDASVTGASGYFQTGFGAKVDQEVLRNLLLNLGADYERDTYRGIDSRAEIVRVSGGALYLVSRSIGLGGTVSYGDRTSHGAFNGPVFNETTGMLTLTLQK